MIFEKSVFIRSYPRPIFVLCFSNIHVKLFVFIRG